MTQEIIERFLVTGPMELPELIYEPFIGKPEVSDDFALIPCFLQRGYSVDELIGKLCAHKGMRLLYHFKTTQATSYGEHFCTFMEPCFEQMYKFNAATTPNGFIDCINVTVFRSLEVMGVDVHGDLQAHIGLLGTVQHMEPKEILSSFSIG